MGELISICMFCLVFLLIFLEHISTVWLRLNEAVDFFSVFKRRPKFENLHYSLNRNMSGCGIKMHM